MRHLVLLSAVALTISPVASAPAFAQTPPAAAQKAKPSLDPNEVVCEKQQDTGSRLASHRVCKTRAEWAEERRTNRMDVDKVQTQRGMNAPQ